MSVIPGFMRKGGFKALRDGPRGPPDTRFTVGGQLFPGKLLPFLTGFELKVEV